MEANSSQVFEDSSAQPKRRGDDDDVVAEFRCLPVGDVTHVVGRTGGVGDLDGEVLRCEKPYEPSAHVAVSADQQDAASGSSGACMDAVLFLRRQRFADQQEHEVFGKSGIDADRGRGLLGAFDHFLFLPVVPCGAARGRLQPPDRGDDTLTLDEVPEQVVVQFAQLVA